MSEKILGLELSAGALTAVVIKKSFKSCTIIDSCWTPYLGRDEAMMPDNSAKGLVGTQPLSKDHGKTQYPSKDHLKRSGWQWDSGSFEDALTVIVSKLDLKGCSASALCLPASLVSFRTMKVPFTSETKVRQILPFELNSHLPMSHGEYLSDFVLVQEFHSNNNCSEAAYVPVATSGVLGRENMNNLSNSQENHIFTASIPVDVMDICFAALKKHGIEPEFVTSQGVVAATCLEDALIIERTESATVISILLKKNVVAVRSFDGKKNQAFIAKSIDQTLAGLSYRYGSQISPNLCYIFSDKNFSGRSDLAISHRDLSEFLTPDIGKIEGCEVKQVNICDYIDIEEAVDLADDVNWFNAMAAALCCVMREKRINFCQGGYAKDSFFHKFRSQLVLFAAFASITIAALFVNIFYDISLLQKEVTLLDRAITQTFKKIFPDVKAVVEPLMQMQVKVREAEKQSGFVPGEKGGSAPVNIRAIDILYELSNRIPQGVDIDVSRFLISEGRVVMAGTTDNFNTVDKIKTLIEKYDKFKSVTISSATADKSGNRVAFNFLIELK